MDVPSEATLCSAQHWPINQFTFRLTRSPRLADTDGPVKRCSNMNFVFLFSAVQRLNARRPFTADFEFRAQPVTAVEAATLVRPRKKTNTCRDGQSRRISEGEQTQFCLITSNQVTWSLRTTPSLTFVSPHLKTMQLISIIGPIDGQWTVFDHSSSSPCTAKTGHLKSTTNTSSSDCFASSASTANGRDGDYTCN